MNNKGFVATPFLIWVVIGLLSVVVVNNGYKGGIPYEQSNLAKYNPTLDTPADTPAPTQNSSSQDQDKALGLLGNLQEVKDFKKRIEDIGRTKPIVEIDSWPNTKIPYYSVHVYEEVQDSPDYSHTATFGWYRVDPKTWTVTRLDLSVENEKWDIVKTTFNNPEHEQQIALGSVPSSVGSVPKDVQQLITHDGTRTGPIVDYFEFCAGKTISIYENERLPYTVDGKTILITKGDIDCYENLLGVIKNDTVSVKKAAESIIRQRGLPTLVGEIATIQLKQPKEALNPMIIGKGTSYIDSLGFTHFSGENGVTGTAYTDSLGFIHYSDSTGRTATFHTDSLGFTTGGGITSHTDSLGFTHFGGGGLSGTAHTDSLGFTHYSDNLGRSTTCHTNTIGFTSCY